VSGYVPDEAPPKEHFEELGTIKVIVLRCQAPGNGPYIPPIATQSSTPANSPTSVSVARNLGNSGASPSTDIFAVDGPNDNLDGPNDWGYGADWGFGNHGSNQSGGGPGQWLNPRFNQHG
jgi:hypothetical protein